MMVNHELQPRHELNDTEPIVTEWEAVGDEALKVRVEQLLGGSPVHLILIDGHSGSGKTTFASKLAALLNAQIVHVDDISWHLDIVDWDREMVEGVIEPWQNGQAIAYKPPGWVKMGREGMVEAPASPVLIIEGVGAGRQSLAGMADLVVWVQANLDEAYERGVERDMAESDRTEREEAVRFWNQWMETENPFLNKEQPWARANLIVNGTPKETDSDCAYIASGPLIT